MTGRFFINDLDAYTTYGMALKKGAFAELLGMPGAWPDEDRSIALPIVIEGKDETDFWIKYNALRAMLLSGNAFTFMAKTLNRRFKLAYKGMSNFTLLTLIAGGDEVYCDFVLNLDDDYPNVFYYTRSATFTKAGGGASVVFSRTYSSFTLADATTLGNADASFNIDGQAKADAAINALDIFITAVIADGGTVDVQLLNDNYYS